MYYVLFNQDGTVQQCYIAGMHPNIPDNAVSVSKEEFDQYCTRQYQKGADGKPQKIEIQEDDTPQIITPAVDQNIADLWQAMLAMSAELEALKGGK